MKIRAIPAAGTILVLGDDLNGQAISSYDRDTPTRIQSVTPVNAPYTTSIFRGLGQPWRSWITEYIFPNTAAAFVFAEQHGDQVPGEFVLEITNDGPGNNGIVFFDGVRETVRCLEQFGNTAKFQYKINVGPSRLTKN